MKRTPSRKTYQTSPNLGRGKQGNGYDDDDDDDDAKDICRLITGLQVGRKVQESLVGNGSQFYYFEVPPRQDLIGGKHL